MTILGVTNSFTGPAETLEVVGNFAYAASGVVAVGSAGSLVESDLVNFQTGNFLLEAAFQFHYGESSTEDFQYKIYFNDQVVVQYVVGDRVGEQPDNVIPMIIPPYTQVKATAASYLHNNDRAQLVTITGKIHRTRD